MTVTQWVCPGDPRSLTYLAWVWRIWHPPSGREVETWTRTGCWRSRTAGRSDRLSSRWIRISEVNQTFVPRKIVLYTQANTLSCTSWCSVNENVWGCSCILICVCMRACVWLCASCEGLQYLPLFLRIMYSAALCSGRLLYRFLNDRLLMTKKVISDSVRKFMWFPKENQENLGC